MMAFHFLRCQAAVLCFLACLLSLSVSADNTPPTDPETVLAVLGLRGVEVVTTRYLQLNFGHSFTSAGDAPSSYRIRSEDDADYGQSKQPLRVGRRSRVEAFIPEGWPYKPLLKHEVFLELPQPLKDGRSYTVIALGKDGMPVTGGRTSLTFTFHERKNISPILKVNQVGYLSDASHKFAYVGLWAGSLGALPLDDLLSRVEFEVVNATRNETVLRGKPRLRHRHDANDEGVYKENLSGEDVWELDISALKQPGEYFVFVPGVGRSFTFRVGADALNEPFRVAMAGLFHQRCGIKLASPQTEWHRDACHQQPVQFTTAVRGKVELKDLPKFVIANRQKTIIGGHHDAGDFNPRTHIEVAQMLFNLYETAPQKFSDGQLNIPESGNGIPDVVDEALWVLRPFLALQDEDGGVCGGIESNGDPNFIQPAEEDPLKEFAFAKEPAVTLLFAGTAAQATRLFRSWRKENEAQDFLRRAQQAWQWAMANGGKERADELAYAAAELFKTTGDMGYHQAFEQVSVFAKNSNAELEEWQKHDQRLACWAYATCERREVNMALRETIRRAIVRRADEWIANAQTYAYRFVKHPYAPISWGTGAYPIWGEVLMWAHKLTGDAKYRDWLSLTCDFALGCHPMGTVFITGLGQRTIHNPLHLLGFYNRVGRMPPGLQSEGPYAVGKQLEEQPTASTSTWWQPTLFPRVGWSPLQTYCDARFMPGMNEGITTNMAKTVMAFGYLLPDRDR